MTADWKWTWICIGLGWCFHAAWSHRDRVLGFVERALTSPGRHDLDGSVESHPAGAWRQHSHVRLVQDGGLDLDVPEWMRARR